MSNCFRSRSRRIPGTTNPSSGDIGHLWPLEHAMLAQDAADPSRTEVFAVTA